MSFALRAQLCSLALSLTLVSRATPQSQSSSAPASTQSSAESAVRAVAEKYFALYAAKDLDGLMSLWSGQSPDLESRKQGMQKLFAGYEKIEMKSLAVLRVTIAGEKARLRVDVEINAVEAKTGKPAAGFGLRKQVMECVKEDGGWRVWR
ncbi:MAG TPA: hypothetical protein VKG02_23615, partial [Blastocatellia bacterium]|nr:hypothetical protein [Blastocatellia bacterium]